MIALDEAAKTDAQFRRRHTWTMWLVGTPSALGGIAIGLTLLQIHWSLSLLVFLAADYIFQYIYSIAYRNAYLQLGREPGWTFKLRALLFQLPIVLLVVGIYFVITIGLGVNG